MRFLILICLLIHPLVKTFQMLDCKEVERKDLEHEAHYCGSAEGQFLPRNQSILLLENVKALVSKKFLPVFNKWKAELESYGYSNFAQVLNAKDYGIPQNRERIFLVSILGDEKYSFPKPFPLELRLKDMLEQNVDERYYLSDKAVKSFAEHCERKQSEGCGFKFEPTDGGVC
jgi:hypothetical protein